MVIQRVSLSKLYYLSITRLEVCNIQSQKNCAEVDSYLINCNTEWMNLIYEIEFKRERWRHNEAGRRCNWPLLFLPKINVSCERISKSPFFLASVSFSFSMLRRGRRTKEAKASPPLAAGTYRSSLICKRTKTIYLFIYKRRHSSGCHTFTLNIGRSSIYLLNLFFLDSSPTYGRPNEWASDHNNHSGHVIERFIPNFVASKRSSSELHFSQSTARNTFQMGQNSAPTEEARWESRSRSLI